MIRSPAHFERLLGSPAAKEDRSDALEGPSATADCGVASNLTATLQSTPHPTASPAVQRGGLEQGRNRKIWGQGHDRGTEGAVEIHRTGAGLAAFQVQCAHRPGRAERPFPAAAERCLRHFIFIIVSVDTCSS